MNTIQEALHELSMQDMQETERSFKPARRHRITEATDIKRRAQRALKDLWDQVYCSLTDSGADSAYDILGDLSGKGKYYVSEVTPGNRFKKPGFNPILVSIKDPSEDDLTDAQYNTLQKIRSCKDARERREKLYQFRQKLLRNRHTLEWAKYIAEVYGLETKQISNEEIVLYVPENAPVNGDVTTRSTQGVAEAFEDETILEEDFDSTLPASPLPHDVVYDFIQNVPVATPTRPPLFFPVGYMKELTREIPAKFRGGRGSEGNPFVRIVKCSEMTVYTGADYENLQATRDMRKETGKERSGERTGFNYEGETAILDKIGISASGEEQLQCYIKRGTQPKAKYWISLDNEDLREATRQEVAQYLTPAHANTLLNGRPEPETPAAGGAKIMRLKLANIYKIGRNGVSVM